MSINDEFYTHGCHNDDYEHIFEYDKHNKGERRMYNNTKRETVECEVEFIGDMKDKRGNNRDGVRVACTKCGHYVDSFGQGENSVKRSLAMLCEECPRGEENWYREE